MDNPKNKLLKQVYYFKKERYVASTIMLIIILFMGFNILRVYNEYIIIQHPETNTIHNSENILSSQGIIEILIEEIEMYPMLEIVINGESFDDKFDENNEIIIMVHDGDVIQINGSMYTNNIKVKIKDMSSNVNNILGNTYVTLERSINTLAIIKI